MAPTDLAKARNHLLRSLDRDACVRLQRHTKLRAVTSQSILYHAGQKIADIYFPETAVLCMLTMMEDGRSIESATVGSEGASWVSASLGAPAMPCQTMVSVGGQVYVIAAAYVEEEIRRNCTFHDLLSEYAHALLISSLRTGACNALHSLTQRCARWMLITLDRTTASHFAITHEFLASLLGCNRPVLTGILGDLEKSGGIHIARGAITITDRSRLEKATCECYGLIRETFQTLQPRGIRTERGEPPS